LNEYSVFWIKQEFALHYFHKSGILYRFIKSYQENLNRQGLSEQFHYITNDFPIDHLIRHFQNNLKIDINIKVTDNEVELSREGHFITLYIYDKNIVFYCETLHEAESLLFPLLRSFHPYLFIAGNNIQNYGWIAPVRINGINKDRQILYSYN